MTEESRVVTANLPGDLVLRMDEIAQRIDRTKSWIIKEAVSDWLAEQERRHALTLEGLKDFDEGRTHSHEDVLAWAEKMKKERRKTPTT